MMNNSSIRDALLLRQNSESLDANSTIPHLGMPSLTITVDHDQNDEVTFPTVYENQLDSRESKPHSPSFQKLDNLSVVRNRLAELNQKNSSEALFDHLPTRIYSNTIRSAPGSRIPSSAAGHDSTRLTMSAPTSPVSVRRVGAREHLLKINGEKPLPPVTGSPDPELIIDSYGMRSPVPKTSTSSDSLVRADSRYGGIPEYHHLSPRLDNFETIPDVTTEIPDEEEVNVHPLVALIKERTQAQCNSTDRLHTQISTLQSEIRNMAKEFNKILPEQIQNTGLSELCARLDHLEKIDNIDDLVKQLYVFVKQSQGGDFDSSTGADRILGDLKELKSGLDAGFPLVLERLNEMAKVRILRIIIPRITHLSPFPRTRESPIYIISWMNYSDIKLLILFFHLIKLQHHLGPQKILWWNIGIFPEAARRRK